MQGPYELRTAIIRPPLRICLSPAQGIKFTDNVIAEPDLPEAVRDATLLIFVLPHQFLGRICPQMTTMAKGCRAISLIKGIEFEESGPVLISNMIKEAMGGTDGLTRARCPDPKHPKQAQTQTC